MWETPFLTQESTGSEQRCWSGQRLLPVPPPHSGLETQSREEPHVPFWSWEGGFVKATSLHRIMMVPTLRISHNLEVRVDFFFHFMPLQTITGPAGVLPSSQDRKSNSGQ
ncbi:uncharacterized protein AAG666_020874 isoform 1-T3 [Megaptera novaeangliae]